MTQCHVTERICWIPRFSKVPCAKAQNYEQHSPDSLSLRKRVWPSETRGEVGGSIRWSREVGGKGEGPEGGVAFACSNEGLKNQGCPSCLASTLFS